MSSGIIKSISFLNLIKFYLLLKNYIKIGSAAENIILNL